MTPEALLKILRQSRAIVAEVRALPEQTESSLARAVLAVQQANDACDEFYASLETNALLERIARC